MKSSERFTSALSQLGSSEVIDKDVTATNEGYVCTLYGLRNFNDVNEARLHFFRKMYAPQKTSYPFHKIKSSDSCCLPPCHKVLHQKLLRTIYLSFLWKNASEANPVDFEPIGHGWKMENCKLVMKWYEGQ